MDLNEPVRLGPEDPALARVLDLLRGGFAYMDGRIDPPSSLHRMGLEDIRAQARTGEIWVLGDPPVACVFLTRKNPVLYLGKLCVAAAHRRQGLAKTLIARAEARCRDLGLEALELETRVELTENHASFARLGFRETARTAHPGYESATSLTMRKPVASR